jgi:hypothetical protein
MVVMLVGVALSEGAIKSLDDRQTSTWPGLGVRFSETYRGTDDLSALIRLSVLKESDGGAATVMPFHTRERPAGHRCS